MSVYGTVIKFRLVTFKFVLVDALSFPFRNTLMRGITAGPPMRPRASAASCASYSLPSISTLINTSTAGAPMSQEPG